MEDKYFKLLFYVIMNVSMFTAVFLYGRKAHPKLSLWLSAGTGVLMIVLGYIEGSWLAASLLLSLVYLFVLRKPNEQTAFRQLYADNKIFSSEKYSQAVLDILGDKKWRYAAGKIEGNGKVPTPYFFWQGSTSSMVSTGQYVRTTVFTHYLAFIFPPGAVSNSFKQKAIASADTSHYTFRQKLKYFFVVDTETPNLVTTAADGSFIIQYQTIPDVLHYAKRINWIKENIDNTHTPVTDTSVGRR